jgi:hypothetical protein
MQRYDIFRALPNFARPIRPIFSKNRANWVLKKKTAKNLEDKE